MTVHFLVYALESGALIRAGAAPALDAVLNAREGDGEGIIIGDAQLTKTEALTNEHGLVLMTGPDIDAVRLTLGRGIDAAAAAAVGPWRPTYLAKETQARELLAGTRALDDAPMIKGQAEITGQTPEEVAQAIVDAADRFAAKTASIEAKRAGAKYLIAQETNLATLAELARIDFTA